jgi:hypothetical protein
LEAVESLCLDTYLFGQKVEIRRILVMDISLLLALIFPILRLLPFFLFFLFKLVAEVVIFFSCDLVSVYERS